MQLRRRLIVFAALALLAAVLIPGSSSGQPTLAQLNQLSYRYSAGRHLAGALSSKIAGESTRIDGYEGSITSLQSRLDVLEKTIEGQRRELGAVQSTLASDRLRLTQLKTDWARDQRVLAAQAVARYESPPPSVVDVIVDANGWDDLLNQLNRVKAIAGTDERTAARVKALRTELSAEASRLAAADARKLRQEAAVVAERDQIANLKLSIVDRELAVARQRRQDSARLVRLRAQLRHEANALESRAEAAAVAAYKTGGVSPVGCITTPYIPHPGPYGFFEAPGTDYTVNQEPVIAARLDALGRALDLHLVGISGYRTPQHSVEVGGFADDPHTQGIASDTPGVEGVPESTLEQFCLTRPFPGPREADHIQERP